MPASGKGDLQGYFVVLPPEEGGGASLDVAEMFRILLTRWWGGIGAGLLGGVLAAAYALSLPNIYESKVLLAPVKNDGAGAASALRSQLGGLAALAGINMGGAAQDRSAEAFATLSADGFVREFIVAENLLPTLFPDRWDAVAKAWDDPKDPPTLADGVKLFKENIQRVSDDRKSGLVTLSIRWQDRELAARWANLLVERINQRMQTEAIADAQRRIDYLNQELAKTSVVAVQEAIFGLIESQVNNSMLANVQKEYVFRVVDPAVPADADRKIAPKRTLYVLFGGFLTGFLWVCWVLARHRERWIRPVSPPSSPGAKAIS